MSSAVQSALHGLCRQTQFPEEHAQSLDPDWTTHYLQLAPGEFSGGLYEARFGDVTIGLEHYNLPMEEMFCAPYETLFFVGAETSAETFCESRPLSRSLNFLCTWDRLLHFVVQGHYSGFYVAVEAATADALLHDRDWRDTLRKHGMVEFRGTGAQEIRRGVASLLGHARDSSDPDEVASLAEDVALATARLMNPLKAGEPGMHASTRSYIYRKARDHMLDRLDKSVAIADICRDLRVSQRTLEYAFKDIVGIGPKRYLTLQRLNRVRAEIVRHGGELSIIEASERWGFNHASRFAESYRRQFIELPSQTCERARTSM